ncbi:MAG: WbqC family protein [Bacteroidales bacterium]|nr:WbqC family protein [Bacteroidales bacterium]
MQENNTILLSSAYFPPIRYFSELVRAESSYIEIHDNYIKQSYRNRCNILSPNGIQSLSVPVERGSFHKVAMKDLRIDYSRPWQRDHLRSLKTAYNSSAFYEYLKDDIELCIEKNHVFLLDMNMEILNIINNILELSLEIKTTVSYKAEATNMIDLRAAIHPKTDSRKLYAALPEYFQVFSPVLGFTPGLSILDLIFNMGPESFSYLKLDAQGS